MTGWLFSGSPDARAAELITTRTDFWIRTDGSARVDQDRGPALDLKGQLKGAENLAPGGGLSTDEIPAGTYDPQLPATLPRAPNDLRAALLQQVNGVQCASATEQTWCLTYEVQQLYSRYVMPADLAAAIWQVLANEPNIRDLGTTTDRLGRPADAIAIPSPPSLPPSQVLVFLTSPTTGRLIGTETVTLHSTALNITKPTVTGFQTWLDDGYVAAAGDRNG
jgi:hypothetical protein